MWRIYYGDGSSLDDSDGQPVGEYARGILAIVQGHNEIGWYILSGSDYYVLRGDRWWGVDIFGLFDWLMDSGLVVFGRTVTNEEFSRVLAAAKADQALGEKTGYLGRGQERRP